MTEPYSYQWDGIKYLIKHKQVLLGDEMGIGKSLQALLAAEMVDLPWLVVCPAYLKNNWKSEIKKHGILVDNLLGIVSYSALGKSGKLFQKASTIIFDEAHYLKTIKAKRTQYAHEYIEEHTPENIYLLTGTPIKNRIMEFYSLLKILGYSDAPNGRNVHEDFPRERKFNDTFSHRIKKNITVRSKNKPPRKISQVSWEGVQNKEGLKSYLRGKYLRRLADKVLDLPDIVEIVVQAGNLSAELEKELYEAYSSNTSISTVKLQAAIIKSKFTADYVTELYEQDEPFVIFTYHPDVAELLEGHLLSCNIETKIISGKTPTESRGEIVDYFQRGKLDGLILTIGAGSTGYTLTRARHLIFNDLSWVPGDNHQAKKRIHRISQKLKCFIHYITAGPVDGRINNNLREKEETIKEII